MFALNWELLQETLLLRCTKNWRMQLIGGTSKKVKNTKYVTELHIKSNAAMFKTVCRNI